MADERDLELLLRSSAPILIIESNEEPRLLRLFTRLAIRLDQPLFRWSITDGLRRGEAEFGRMTGTESPTDVLKHIRSAPKAGLYVLLDFHPYLDDPLHVRLIKEIAQDYAESARTLIFVSHQVKIPSEIQHLTSNFEVRLPDSAALRRLVKQEARSWQDSNARKVQVDRQALEQLTHNLSGVTETDARRLVRHAIEDDGAITKSDLPQMMQAKYRLLNQDGVISFEYDTASFSEVAGLHNLKKWLEHRAPAFREQNSTLDKPKGMLLLGVQGGGKSLAAKATAGFFGLPLLKLDFAALYNKFIGESERNLRQALNTAETMAPCVLWIDEIEKGLANNEGEDGTSRRILGTLLTWMAENKALVFITATANDISRLPPELIRKGRLDEIFFVDLPDDEIRQAIFHIHLRKRNLAPSGFDLAALVEASEGFSGAEIEQAVVSGLYHAQAKKIPLDSDILLQEIDSTRPLSVVMAEEIAKLRTWAADRTLAA